MEAVTSNSSFIRFLSFFPKSDLPLTIQHSDHHVYSKANDPLPDSLLREFIIPYLDFEVDEFTEFLPCFQFESKYKLHHVILWTARLMHYSFYLLNFDRNGRFLDLLEIAGFYSEKNQIVQKMTHVDADAKIFLVEAGLSELQQELNPEKTRKWKIEILPDGSLESSLAGL